MFGSMIRTTATIIAGALQKISFTFVGRERATKNIASGKSAAPKNSRNIGNGGTAIPIMAMRSINAV
jgi:hypothetical protein